MRLEGKKLSEKRSSVSTQNGADSRDQNVSNKQKRNKLFDFSRNLELACDTIKCLSLVLQQILPSGVVEVLIIYSIGRFVLVKEPSE